MKFLDKMILCIFSVLILLMAVISSACIFGWIDATGLYVFVTKALADQTTCNILLGLNVVLILFAIKGIFFESSTDEEKSVGNGIMLENDDGKLLVTKETITSIVNSVVAGFEGVKDQQSKITLDDIHSFLAYLTTNYNSKASTRSRKVSSLRVFFNYLCLKNLIEKNPTQNLETPKLDRRLPKYLTLEQSKKLLEASENEDNRNNERDHAITTLFLNCGMRLSELVGINLKDLDLN